MNQQQQKNIQAQMLNFLNPNSTEGQRQTQKTCIGLNQQYSNVNSPRQTQQQTPFTFVGNQKNRDSINGQSLQQVQFSQQLQLQKVNEMKRMNSTSSCLSDRSNYPNNLSNTLQSANLLTNYGQITQRNQSTYHPSQLQVTPLRMNELEFKHLQNQTPQPQNYLQAQQQCKQSLENGDQQNRSLQQQIQNRMNNVGKNFQSKNIQSSSCAGDRIQLTTNPQGKKINRKEDQENIDIHKNQQFNLLKSQEQGDQVNKKQQQQNNSSYGIRLLNNMIGKNKNNQENGQDRKGNNITQIVGDKKLQQFTIKSNEARQNCHQFAMSTTQSQESTETDNQIRGVRLLSQTNTIKLLETQAQGQTKNSQPETSLASSTTSFQGGQYKMLRSASQPFVDHQQLLHRQQSCQGYQTQYQQQSSTSLQQSQVVSLLPSSQQYSQTINKQYQFFQSVNQFPISTNNSQQFSSNQINSYSNTPRDVQPYQSQQITSPKTVSLNQSNLQSQNKKPNLTQQLSPKQNPFAEKHVIVPLQVVRSQSENIFLQQKPSNFSQNIPPQLNQNYQQQYNQPKLGISRSSSFYSQGAVVVKNNDASPNLSVCRYDKKQLYQNLVDKNCEDDKISQFPPSIPQSFTTTPKQQYHYRQIQNEPINTFNIQGNLHHQQPTGLSTQTVDQIQNIGLYNHLNQYQNLNIYDQRKPIELNVKRPSFDSSNYQSNYLQELSPSFGNNNCFPQQQNQVSNNLVQNWRLSNENFQELKKPSITQPVIQVQNEFQQNIQINIEQNQEFREDAKIEIQSIENLQSPNKQCQEAVKVNEPASIVNQPTISVNIDEASKSRDSTKKSPNKNIPNTKIEDYDSPIHLFGGQNMNEQNIQQQPKIIDFSSSKSPSKSMELTEDERMWNMISPDVRKAIVQLNINKYCDEVIIQIAKEKELRQLQQGSTPNKNQEGTEQNANNEFINNPDSSFFKEEKVKRALNKSRDNESHKSINSSSKPQSLTNISQNNRNSVSPQRISSQPLITAINQFNLQTPQPEFLKVDQILKQQQNQQLQNFNETSSSNSKLSKHSNNLSNRKLQINLQDVDNQDQENISAPQFTFSNTKKNVSFEQEKFEQKMLNEFEFTPQRENIISKQSSCNKSRSDIQNSANSYKSFNDQQQMIINERSQGVLNSIEKRQNSSESGDNKRIINLQVVETRNQDQLQSDFLNEKDLTNSYYLNNGDSDQKSVILQKYTKFDTPDNRFERLSLSNQQISQLNNPVNVSNTKINNSNEKLSNSKTKLSNSINQSNQLNNFKQPNEKCLQSQQQLQQQQVIQATKHFSNQKVKEKIQLNNSAEQQKLKPLNIKNLNIDYLEKEADMIQQHFSSELVFTPKNQLEHFGLNYETRKEKKLRILQENIQKNVEKVLPNIKDNELKKITSSIYESVFSLLREKYNIEVSSSSKSSDHSSSLHTLSQNNLISQRNQSSVRRTSESKFIKDVQPIDFTIKKQIEHNLKKELPQDLKEINVSPTNCIFNINMRINENSPIKQKAEINFKGQQQLESKNSSHEHKETQDRDNYTLMIPSHFEEEEIISRGRRQSDDFKQLLLTQEFEGEDEDIFGQQKQDQTEERQLLEDEVRMINPNIFSNENNDFTQEEENSNYCQQFSYKKNNNCYQMPVTHTTQKNQVGLSPIREIESTYDQIQQSNFGKNTHQDYVNTSTDERLGSNQYNYDTQKSRSNFQTQRGIEEELEEDEENQNQITSILRGSNSLQQSNSFKEQQQKFKLTTSLLKNKMSPRNLQLNQQLENQDLVDNLERFEQEQQLTQDLLRNQEIQRTRQAYYENNKQKNYIFVPLAQQQESQILCSISPIHQNSSSQSSFTHSRKQSFQYQQKHSSAIEDWEQFSTLSKTLYKTNYFTNSISNFHSRKSSLQSLAIVSPPISAQNTKRAVGSSQNPKQQKEEKPLPVKNFAQEYLKKCQSKKRQQEGKEMERIKQTLIANLKYGTNQTNQIKGEKKDKIILRSISSENKNFKKK